MQRVRAILPQVDIYPHTLPIRLPALLLRHTPQTRRSQQARQGHPMDDLSTYKPVVDRLAWNIGYVLCMSVITLKRLHKVM